MTTRALFVPTASFAAGAYAQKNGAIDDAFAALRASHPSVGAVVDGLVAPRGESGAAANIERATSDAIGRALRAARDAWSGAFGSLSDNAEADVVLGGGAATATAVKTAVKATTTTANGGLPVVLNSAAVVRGFFIVGVATGCVAAYVVGPERCVAECKKAMEKARKTVRRIRVRVVRACRETYDKLPSPLAAVDAAKVVIIDVAGRCAPALRSIRATTRETLERGGAYSAELARKLRALAGDFHEHHIIGTVDVARTKFTAGVDSVKGFARRASVQAKPALDRARRVARELIASVIDTIAEKTKTGK